MSIPTYNRMLTTTLRMATGNWRIKELLARNVISYVTPSILSNCIPLGYYESW